MNMTMLPSLDVLLLIARAVFLLVAFVIAAVTFRAWRRATDRQTEQILSLSQELLGRLAVLETRLDATSAVLARIDERSERQAHLANGTPADYQVAIRLARGGASREELMSRCGLSIGEADLVRRLHHSATGAVAA
jgi:membrane protein implicated in regulation of membrane protease activity